MPAPAKGEVHGGRKVTNLSSDLIAEGVSERVMADGRVVAIQRKWYWHNTTSGRHYQRLPGKDSLVSHPSGGLCAFERIDFMAPPSTWGWEGKVFCSEDKGRSWRVRTPLVDRIPE